MPSLRDIRRRIKSVKNTAQITKAMQMVAASKMRKAQQAALDGRPYAELMNRVLVSVREKVDPTIHPLLEQRPVRSQLVILISTDKGLCGGLNTNLFREVMAFDAATTQFIAIGRKGAQFIARTKRNLVADFSLKDQPSFAEVKPISKFCIEKFLAQEVDKVTVLYPFFVNTLTQRPLQFPLLPITSLDEVGLEGGEFDPITSGDAEIIFEPGEWEVLDAILPFYLHFELFQMVLASRASEHSARMVAMKSATDNAKQLVKDLSLEYNKARQASITTQILEIATAQLAVE
jgi:F-type H+-transporting ATPase subunit gamma